MEGNHEAQLKGSRHWFIIIGILLAWAIGATIAGLHFHGKFSELHAIVQSADGSDLARMVEQQRDTIITLRNDLDTAAEYIRAADEYAAGIEQRDRRIYEYVKLTDAELIDFGNTMASSGGTLQAAINLQQRSIEAFGRIKANNSAIKMEFGVRP
jgi:predicted sulfurtransferase